MLSFGVNIEKCPSAEWTTINLDPHDIVMRDLEIKSQMIEIDFIANINNQLAT